MHTPRRHEVVLPSIDGSSHHSITSWGAPSASANSQASPMSPYASEAAASVQRRLRMIERREIREEQRLGDRHSVHSRSFVGPPPGKIALTSEAAAKLRSRDDTLYNIAEIKPPDGWNRKRIIVQNLPPPSQPAVPREKFGISGRSGGLGVERLSSLVSSLADSAPMHLNDSTATDSLRLREARLATVQGVSDRTRRMKWRRAWLRGLTQSTAEAAERLDAALRLSAAPLATAKDPNHASYAISQPMDHGVSRLTWSIPTALKRGSALIRVRSYFQESAAPLGGQVDLNEIFLPCSTLGCPVEACLWSTQEHRAYCPACWPLVPFHLSADIVVSKEVWRRAGKGRIGHREAHALDSSIRCCFAGAERSRAHIGKCSTRRRRRLNILG